MKRLLLVTASVLALGLLAVGCNQAPGDEEQIRTLLGSSSYTDEDNTRSYGAEDSTPSGNDPGDADFLMPFVRFRRYIPPGGVTRTVNVAIPAYPGYPDTTALATVTADIYGQFHTLFDTTTNPLQVWRKPFHDQAVRRAYLTKNDDGWHVRKVTPIEFTTVDAAYTLRVGEIVVHAASWPDADTFRLTDPDTLLAKSELPSFIPDDSVTVRITVESSGDSCWAFLHHGRRRWPNRWRRAYFKTGTFTFQRTWHIAGETYEKPEVRPSGHDAIGWNTLFADTTGPYVASAWGFPYIVREPGDPIPEE
jgi:hypothetical protein